MKLTPTSARVPFCNNCDTAKYLQYEEFVPFQILPSGRVRPGSVNYTCMRCGEFSGHNPPAAWEPPGWFWYA